MLAVEVTCAAAARPDGQAQHHRRVPALGLHRPDWNPGGLWRPVRIERTGPVRIDRLRVLCRDADDDARPRLRSAPSSTATRPAPCGSAPRVDGAVERELEQSLAGGHQRGRVDPRHRRPAPVVAVGARRPAADRRRRRGLGRRRGRAIAARVRTGLRAGGAAPTGCSRVNGERLFLKGANLAPTRMALGEATPERAAPRRRAGRARPGSTCCGSTATSPGPSSTTPPTSSGMLLWQDFPLQWGYARTVRKQAVRQAARGRRPARPPPVDRRCGAAQRAGRARRAPGEPIADRRSRPSSSSPASSCRRGTRSSSTAGQARLRAGRRHAARSIAHSGVRPTSRSSTAPTATSTSAGTTATSATCRASPRPCPAWCASSASSAPRRCPPTPTFMEPERWPDLDWERLAASTTGCRRRVFDERRAAGRLRHVRRRGATRRSATRPRLLRHHIETLRRLKYRPTGGFCLFMLADAHPAVTWSRARPRPRSRSWPTTALVEACRPVIVVADRLPAPVAARRRAGPRRPRRQRPARAARGRRRSRPTCRWPGGDHGWRWRGDVAADACVRVGTVQFVVPDAPGRARARPRPRGRRRRGHQPLREPHHRT